MNSGLANKATIRLILWSLAALVGLFLAAWVGRELGGFVLAYHKIFIVLWLAFLLAALYLSRDPDPIEPTDLNAIVAPAHGKVDGIAETTETDFMQGACKRISIRIALTDVQVQYAPLTATVAQFKHQPATREDDRTTPENLFIGLDVVGRPNTRAALRLVGGSWGRRILPWIKSNDVVSRSVRIAMMRPGSRVEMFLPPQVKMQVNVGDAVAGGQTVIAKFD